MTIPVIGAVQIAALFLANFNRPNFSGRKTSVPAAIGDADDAESEMRLSSRVGSETDMTSSCSSSDSASHMSDNSDDAEHFD